MSQALYIEHIKVHRQSIYRNSCRPSCELKFSIQSNKYTSSHTERLEVARFHRYKFIFYDGGWSNGGGPDGGGPN